MKTIHLHQIIALNVGVISELRVGGITIFGLETQDCLEPGDYVVKMVNGRYQIKEGYHIGMESNGKYRNKGLVVGMDFRFDSFDLNRKGDAMQLLFNGSESGFKLVVSRTSTDAADKVTSTLEQLKEAKAEFDAYKQESEASVKALIATHEAEISELKKTLAWAVKNDKLPTAASDKVAKQTLDSLEEGNEPDGNHSGD